MKFLKLLVFLGCVSCANGPAPITPGSKVERQMVGLLEKFDRWDEDGNGKLSARELKQAEQLSGRPAARILDFYDTNRDGGISLREAQSGLSRIEEAELRVKR